MCTPPCDIVLTSCSESFLYFFFSTFFIIWISLDSVSQRFFLPVCLTFLPLIICSSIEHGHFITLPPSHTCLTSLPLISFVPL